MTCDSINPTTIRCRLDRMEDVERVVILAAWRVSVGIYRFDPALYAALFDTPVAGDLPCDVTYCLSERCFYIQTPNLEWLGAPLHGVFAHLEYDATNGRHDLRLLMNGEADLTPVRIHLGQWNPDEVLARMFGHRPHLGCHTRCAYTVWRPRFTGPDG